MGITELLSLSPKLRTAAVYEDAFSGFIAAAGGCKLGEAIVIPPSSLNADYLLPIDECDVLLELKQLARFDRTKSLDAYFAERFRLGKLVGPLIPGGKMTLRFSDLSESDKQHFIKRFRPSVGDALSKANRQLKASGRFLEGRSRSIVNVVVLLNTGDYHTGVDLLMRIAQGKAQREWARGNFSHLDGILCLSLDMVPEDRSIFHGRGVVRVKEERLERVVNTVYDRWLRYVAPAFGMEVTYDPKASAEPTPASVKGFKGKLTRHE